MAGTGTGSVAQLPHPRATASAGGTDFVAGDPTCTMYLTGIAGPGAAKSHDGTALRIVVFRDGVYDDMALRLIVRCRAGRGQ